MKRIWAILLSVFMLLGLFAGCDTTPTESSEPTESVTSEDTGSESSDAVAESTGDVTSEEESAAQSEAESTASSSDSAGATTKSPTAGNTTKASTTKKPTTTTQKPAVGESYKAYAADMFVNVKDEGAVGDGKADDTKAIQRALNSSTGKTVYFPAGTYKITAPLMISSQTNMLGQAATDGVGGSVILAGANMNAILTSENFKALHMTIGNLTLDGGASSGKKVTWALDLYDCRNTRVFNCRFTNLTGGGLNVAAKNENYVWINHFDRLQFDNLKGYAIYEVASDSFFSNIDVNGGQGIVDWNYSGNCYSNVRVRNSTGYGIQVGREGISEVGNTTLRNCTFENNALSGVYVGSPVNQSRGKQVTIRDCEFSGNGGGDICGDNSAMYTVYNSNLRSADPLVADKSRGITLMNVTSKVALDVSTAINVYQKDNQVSSSFTTTGYQANKDTDFPFYDTVFAIMGGSSKYTYVNVKNAGSPEGRDWGPVIQKAINSLPSSGGVVYFPSGTYYIGTQVKVPSNVYLVGDGQMRTDMFKPVGTLESMFLLTGQNNGFISCAIGDNAGSNCSVAGVYMKGAKNCFFYNSSLGAGDNMPHALYVDKNSSKIHINTGSLGGAASNKSVVLMSGTNCVVQNQYASGGPSMILKGGKNNVLQSNHFECCPYTHITIQNDGTAAMNHVITSNYFDVNDCCVKLAFSTPMNCGVEISCNTFRTDAREKDPETGYNPPELRLTSVKGVKIFANTFQQGLSIYTNGVACADSFICGNILGTPGNAFFTEDSKELGSGCTVEGNNYTK